MRDRNYEIYHKYLFEGIWSEDDRLTFSSEDSKRPVMAVDSLNRVHLVYNDLKEGNKEIYHRMWSGFWLAETRVSNSSGDSFAASIAAKDLTVHLAYQEVVDGYLQIIYHSYDLFTWSSPEQLSFVQSGMSMVPTIAVGPDGTVHVAWWDTREDSPGVSPGKVCYRKKTGSTWSEEEVVSGPLADAMRPNIAVDDSGYVHVAWIDQREPMEQIYYRRFGPGGWEPEICVTSGSYTHYHPSLALTGDGLNLVYWANYPSPATAGVYFRKYSGAAWSPRTRISGSASSASLCAIASQPDGTLHVAWKDARDGNDEIYYNAYIPPDNSVGDDEDPPVPDGLIDLFSVDTYPNPFSGSTNIRFSLPRAADVDIRIYDISGRCVRHFVSRRMETGEYPFRWDGTDDSGNRLAPGMYIAAARAGKMRTTSKLFLLR